ncbi:MAG: hypothetical protein IBX53_09730 [Halomonas sp.]|uniref:hypothetical protein n=1 Tax=Halomonas sp. TaxID=1486246 RepID=UPI0019E121EF|nr:hypothetical protein [Halomonas sp.]MBE0489348.1 hypothetical protein [Halomonas sp.]
MPSNSRACPLFLGKAMLTLPLDELPADALQQALEEIHQRASQEETPQGDTP